MNFHHERNSSFAGRPVRKSNWSEGEVEIKILKSIFSWQRKIQLTARFKATTVQL